MHEIEEQQYISGDNNINTSNVNPKYLKILC